MQQEQIKDLNNEPSTLEKTAENPTSPVAKKSSHRAPFWGDIVVMILLFFLSQFAGAIICNWIGISPSSNTLEESLAHDILEDTFTALQSRYIACSFAIAMVLCFITLHIYRKLRGWGKIISLRTPGWSYPFRLLCAYILMWCFSITIEPLAGMFGNGPEQILSGGWLLLSAIISAPLFEETLFRGYIAGTLRRAYGTLAAWIISSLLFGLAHGTPSTIITASFSGLILCYCYLRYRSLLFAIILHAMNNATACFMMSIGLGDSTIREIITNNQVYWAVYAFCLSITIIAIARMWQVVKTLKSDKYLH